MTMTMTSYAASLRRARTAVPARTAVLTFGAGLLLAGCSFTVGPQKTATADATVTEAVTGVEVTGARAGSIEVVPGSGPGVTVRRTVHYRGDTAPRPGQHVSAGLLTFSDGCASASATCFIDYRLEVPASATVKLESSSGRITVTGVAAAELTADSGAVRADRITGPLKARTSSGRITASGLAGPTAEIRSESGDARLDFAQAPSSVLAETSSGDVTLRVPRAAYRLAVTTTSGVRDVSLPADPSAPSHLSARTTSGDVRISALGG